MVEYLRNKVYLGNSLYDYAIAALIFFGIILSVAILRRIAVFYLHKLEKYSENVFVTQLIAALRRRLLPITYSLAVFGVLSYLKIPAFISDRVGKLLAVFISIFVIFFIADAVRNFGENYKSSIKRNPLPSGIISILQFLVWVAGILFIFSNLGYNISAFITGLGIGGVAIALASQAILGDLFNYFVILFDKPFKKGDSIQIGTQQGTVEYIGIKSTRLRSVTGEMLLISNTDLTKSRIQNFRAAKKRRCLMTLGVVYSTSPEKLRQLPDIIQKVVESVPETEFQRVHFSEFASSSLNFELAYFVLTNEYTDYVKTVQEVNFRIVEAIKGAGVEFAYPTQTLYVEKNIATA